MSAGGAVNGGERVANEFDSALLQQNIRRLFNRIRGPDARSVGSVLSYVGHGEDLKSLLGSAKRCFLDCLNSHSGSAWL